MRHTVSARVAGVFAGLPVLCAADPVRLDTVVVTGTRESLQSAQIIKRDNLGIVDSVVAAEIAKLPDLNVSDAVQRVPGVQIVRDRGEGSLPGASLQWRMAPCKPVPAACLSMTTPCVSWWHLA